MPNPYAARAQRDSAPSFPETRLRRVGMTDDELAEAREGWASMSIDERAQASAALAQLTDEELTESLVESREGDEPVAECLICADLPDELREQLPEHEPNAHVTTPTGGAIFESSPPFIGDDGDGSVPWPETDLQPYTREWFDIALPDGPAVVAEHDGEQLLPGALTGVVEPLAQGGPGEAAEGSGDGTAPDPEPSPKRTKRSR